MDQALWKCTLPQRLANLYPRELISFLDLFVIPLRSPALGLKGIASAGA